jgi:hypothetical protein
MFSLGFSKSVSILILFYTVVSKLIQLNAGLRHPWIPASAGMTIEDWNDNRGGRE